LIINVLLLLLLYCYYYFLFLGKSRPITMKRFYVTFVQYNLKICTKFQRSYTYHYQSESSKYSNGRHVLASHSETNFPFQKLHIFESSVTVPRISGLLTYTNFRQYEYQFISSYVCRIITNRSESENTRLGYPTRALRSYQISRKSVYWFRH
jgi:hypothetical protein